MPKGSAKSRAHPQAPLAENGKTVYKGTSQLAIDQFIFPYGQLDPGNRRVRTAMLSFNLKKLAALLHALIRQLSAAAAMLLETVIAAAFPGFAAQRSAGVGSGIGAA